MPTELLTRNNIAGCREIRFLDRQESNYPTLMRFCMDFDLCVLQIMRSSDLYSNNPVFTLVNGDYGSTDIQHHCPCQPSLQSLEHYVQLHQVDILHAYLFDATAPKEAQPRF